MTTHPLEARNGYLLATVDDRRWLVDTGCPFSFGPGQLSLGGRLRVLPKAAAGFHPEVLSGLTGVEVAGILGSDVLLEGGCRIDVPKGELLLSPTQRTGRKVSCSRQSVLGSSVPTVEGTLQGRPARIVFDTGAPLGYLPRGRANGHGRTGVMQRDYIAMAQQWHQTEVWSLPLGLGGRLHPLHWGELPDRFDALFTLASMDGIFGGELCLTHAVTLGPGGEGLWIEEREAAS